MALPDPRQFIGRTELKGAKAQSFPPTIDNEIQNFFELKFVNYDRNASLAKANESPNSHTIFLPVPVNLEDTTRLDYGEYQSFGGIDNLLQQGTSSDMAAMGVESAKGFMQAMALAGAKYAPELLSSVIKDRARLDVSGLAGRASAVIGTSVGALANPALAVEFRGIQRKTYNFSWRFTPRSKAESETLAAIIDAIRWNTLPEKVAGDWILTYPNIAFMHLHGNLEYGSENAKRRLIQFAPQGAVCEAMNVSYNNSSGQQSFYEITGEPIEVILNLVFADRGIISRNEIPTEKWKS